MDLPANSGDVLSQPTRARIFAALMEHKAPIGTEQLAEQLGMHQNGVRRHLKRLEDAGMVERRQDRGKRGRPGDRWLLAPGAHPGGERPSGYAELAGWLVSAIPAKPGRLREVEKAGLKIGQQLAPHQPEDPIESFRQVATALGFQPEIEMNDEGGFTCSLENCPYRESVRENPEVVCSLHRGITKGLLAELDPDARLVRFEPHDPDRAGCLVGVRVKGSG